MLKYTELKIDDLEKIIEWRNADISVLRTPYMLTVEQQVDWYNREICNRNSHTRFFAIRKNNELIGYGGIENIQWENGLGELSLLIDPAERNHGYGKDAANFFIDYGLHNLRLSYIWGEVYYNNSALRFWKDVISMYHYKQTVVIPRRKFYGGKYFDSLFFIVGDKEE